MCGILGHVGQISPDVRHRFGAALQSIAHRGPDGHAIWANSSLLLGHRRLAVIDLSAAAAQPMSDPETGCVIVFNGEIYNYLELRSELAAAGVEFRSQSDTEVLLRGYLRWGPEILQRANGMWAFAIWDPKKQEVFLARDRFGVKPLYYRFANGELTFASEPKAIHALIPSSAVIDPDAVIDLFANSSIHTGEQTFYQGMKALPPAHFLTFRVRQGQTALSRYWDYPSVDDVAPEASVEAQDQFASLFEDAVRLRMRSDVQVGLTLSGGLDSSSVLAASNATGASALRSYTSTFGHSEASESGWADLAASLAGTTATHVISSLDDWTDTIEHVVHHMDSPGYSPAVLPLWSIMAKARADNVPVLLEGQGADELLTGYPRYSAINALQKLRHGHVASALEAMRAMQRTFTSSWSAAWLGREAFPSLASMLSRDRRLRLVAPEALQRWRARSPDTTLSRVGESYDPLRSALWRDHSQAILPALLQYGDAVSMAHGIESRLPFMDYRLVEWIFRSRPDLMVAGQSKSLLRRYLSRRGFEQIANRIDKQGYPVPLASWYTRVGHHRIDSILEDRSDPLWDLLDASGVRNLAQRASSGSTTALFHLYKIFTTSIWMRRIAERRVVTSIPVRALG